MYYLEQKDFSNYVLICFTNPYYKYFWISFLKKFKVKKNEKLQIQVFYFELVTKKMKI